MSKLQGPVFQKIKKIALKILSILKKFGVAIIALTILLTGFIFGARLHELGKLDNVFGKNLVGATVRISGLCFVDGEERIPALSEDQVKITSVDEKKIMGVVRLTREIITCDKEKIAIDTLPLLSKWNVLEEIPALTERERKIEVSPYKLLENNVILASGTCQDLVSKSVLPPFTDEKIDITLVEEDKESKGTYLLSGIRRSDKVSMICSSRSIKWSLDDGKEEVVFVKPPVTFLGKTILVNSKCTLDPRMPKPVNSKGGTAMNFVNLINTPVQVMEEQIVQDKLVKFTGTILDKTGDKNLFGLRIVCDKEVYPILYTESDEYAADPVQEPSKVE